MKKLYVLIGVVLLSTMFLFANSEKPEILFDGTSTVHGDYVVVTTNDVYYYQGKEYEVYKVMYDDPKGNIYIGVNGKEYVAYNEDFIFFYECTRNGFGVRKVLFSNPQARDEFDAEKFSSQSILSVDKKINNNTAIELIAVFVPKLRVGDV